MKTHTLTRKTNTYTLTKPNGEVYATVTCEDGRLKINLTQYYNVSVMMDEKIIPQLRDALNMLDEDRKEFEYAMDQARGY